MLLSFFIPIIGGLIVYLLKKKKDKDLANICLICALINPLLIFFFVFIFFAYLNVVYNSISINIASLVIIISLEFVFNLSIIKNVIPKNQYRYFLPVFWFGLIGAVYSYYFAYKTNENLKNNVGWFFFFQLFLFIIGGIFMSILAAILALA